MAINGFMTDWMAGDAVDRIGWRRTGETLALLHSIFNVLGIVDAVAGNTVTTVDNISVAHGSRNMTSCAAWGNGNHVMLDSGWRCWVIECVLHPVTVCAILLDSRHAVGNRVNDLRPGAGVTLGAGVFVATEGHDMNNACGARVWAIVTG